MAGMDMTPGHSDSRSDGSEQAALNQQQPPMPAVRLQLPRFYLAERKEQHGEYKQGLKNSHGLLQKRTCRMQLRQAMINKIQ